MLLLNFWRDSSVQTRGLFFTLQRAEHALLQNLFGTHVCVNSVWHHSHWTTGRNTCGRFEGNKLPSSQILGGFPPPRGEELVVRGADDGAVAEVDFDGGSDFVFEDMQD